MNGAAEKAGNAIARDSRLQKYKRDVRILYNSLYQKILHKEIPKLQYDSIIVSIINIWNETPGSTKGFQYIWVSFSKTKFLIELA